MQTANLLCCGAFFVSSTELYSSSPFATIMVFNHAAFGDQGAGKEVLVMSSSFDLCALRPHRGHLSAS